MTTIVAHVGDLHVNSTVALMPPKVTLDDGQTVRQSETQKWLWAKWLDYWQRTHAYKEQTGARIVGVIGGDWGDVNKHSHYQLITSNRDTVLDMMIDVIAPALPVCDEIVVWRGTEAHTGPLGWLENRAAKEVGAVTNGAEGSRSWYYFEGEFDGVRIAGAHHPGTNSTRPWTAGNEANRRAAMDVYNYAGAAWVPHLTLWGHYHHNADSGDTHPIRAIYNRCWQVKTAFIHRLGMGQQSDVIGGQWIFCHEGQYKVQKQGYALPRPEPLTL